MRLPKRHNIEQEKRSRRAWDILIFERIVGAPFAAKRLSLRHAASEKGRQSDNHACDDRHDDQANQDFVVRLLWCFRGCRHRKGSFSVKGCTQS